MIIKKYITLEQIALNNKIIVDFMNIKNVFEYRIDNSLLGLYIADDNTGYIDYKYDVNYIDYHKSYDSLMCVVQKIRAVYGLNFTISSTSGCTFYDDNFKSMAQGFSLSFHIENKDLIYSIWYACIEVIKKYKIKK